MYFTKVRQVLQGIFTEEAPQVAMAKVRLRTLRINKLAVDMLEEALDDTHRDEVWEGV